MITGNVLHFHILYLLANAVMNYLSILLQGVFTKYGAMMKLSRNVLLYINVIIKDVIFRYDVADMTLYLVGDEQLVLAQPMPIERLPF